MKASSSQRTKISSDHSDSSNSKRFGVSAISLGEVIRINERQQSFPRGMLACPYHFHLRHSLSGKERLENPKYPTKNGGDIDEELLMLLSIKSMVSDHVDNIGQ